MKIPRSCENTEEWQIGADRGGKYAAIPITRIHRATLNDLSTFVLLAGILDWTIAKGVADWILA